ncbi:MAG: cell filamentation protein Fic [Proteobacteria bacterium]|nr:cell filamentation protein Fic [Pseudomonadota bacterium]
MSRYDGSDSYTFPDSEILKNKADLHDQAALDAFEADATAIRLLELIEHPIQGNFDLAHLKAIHRHLFQDVYDWAGQLRTVDISKGSSRFGNCGLIEAYLGQELAKISGENFLIGFKPETFVERLAHYLSEINAAHPFREGNGRVQRAFCSQLAEQAGYFIDFAEVSHGEMYAAMIASFHGDNKPLESLLGRIGAIIE